MTALFPFDAWRDHYRLTPQQAAALARLADAPAVGFPWKIGPFDVREQTLMALIARHFATQSEAWKVEITTFGRDAVQWLDR